jgi:ABC-2 type transport system ATP-binding protein
MDITTDRLTRSFGSFAALKSVDLRLKPGITGILGPNGAGKTTLLRILATLLKPTSGSVKVGDWDLGSVAGRREVRRRLGYLPQEVGLYPRFTVFQFVNYIAILKELNNARDRHRRVREALEAVGLADQAARRISRLSGGMRRRVGIAQAIVANPELLLLDEATGGLDPEQRMRFRQLIASLGERRTVVLSTHLVEDVAAICTDLIVLWNGEVLFQGQPSALRAKAEGLVWSAAEAPTSALISWRTESGMLRVISPDPGPGATPVAPTLEDGYLLVTSASSLGARSVGAQ